jgi:DNA-binding NtrC family response regulator
MNGGRPCYGFAIRDVELRLGARPAPPVPVPGARSVEQLTELIGRVPMKDLVREATDMIERLCIEAALVYTSDNRASAAEILGVSRQSLYSKLHRHGLGNLSDNEG